MELKVHSFVFLSLKNWPYENFGLKVIRRESWQEFVLVELPQLKTLIFLKGPV